MCLAIPGRIVEFVNEESQLAKVDVAGVRRNVNIGLLDRSLISVGDFVLIHVGFALSRVDEVEALATLRLLEELGEMQAETAREMTGQTK